MAAINPLSVTAFYPQLVPERGANRLEPRFVTLPATIAARHEIARHLTGCISEADASLIVHAVPTIRAIEEIEQTRRLQVPIEYSVSNLPWQRAQDLIVEGCVA